MYFVKEMFEPVLLRRVDLVDQAWSGSGWYPTPAIVNYMYMHDDFVDEITEAEAVAHWPAAFATAEGEHGGSR